MAGATKLTDSQRTAMIAHHEKMARAYRQYGQTDNAESAERLASELRVAE